MDNDATRAHDKRRRTGNLQPHRTVLLKESTKREAMRELVDVICADSGTKMDADELMDAVWEREEALSTRIVPHIAIPHARVDVIEQPMLAVGKSIEGIAWEDGEDTPVFLVIMIVGAGNEHLQALSNIAIRLSNEQIYEKLINAKDTRSVYNLLTAPYPLGKQVPRPAPRDYSITCFAHTLSMAREMGVATVILHADAVGDISFLDSYKLKGLSLIVISQDVSRYPSCDKVSHFITVPFRGMNRSNQMDVAFLFLISQGLLSRADLAISVCGMPESGMLDTIMVSNLKEEYHNFFPEHNVEGAADVEPQVLSRILQVASNLADEGREGRSVGTMFILGDSDKVGEYCRQMIINPFKGYKEDDRNILDPGIEETVKEFSRIDGAFILRGDGVILSAGTFIRVETDVEQLTPGLGARHAVGALISRQTKALSVVLSESTRKISLYRNGELLLKL